MKFLFAFPGVIGRARLCKTTYSYYIQNSQFIVHFHGNDSTSLYREEARFFILGSCSIGHVGSRGNAIEL